MSLLQPTIKQKVKNSLLPLTFYNKNNREPNAGEDSLMLRQQMAGNTMGEGLISSILSSIARTDYVRTLGLPDTFISYLTVITLHTYPMLVRLNQFPTDEIGTVRKQVFVSRLFEDIKARLRYNATDMKTIRALLHSYTQNQQTSYLRLDEGLMSGCGKELSGALARVVYRQSEGGEETMQQLLLISEWLLETLDLLQTYSNEEFVELCIFGEGFHYPLLGEYRPVKPEKLYTLLDLEELGGIPEHLKDLASVVTNKVQR